MMWAHSSGITEAIHVSIITATSTSLSLKIPSSSSTMFVRARVMDSSMMGRRGMDTARQVLWMLLRLGVQIPADSGRVFNLLPTMVAMDLCLWAPARQPRRVGPLLQSPIWQSLNHRVAQMRLVTGLAQEFKESSSALECYP